MRGRQVGGMRQRAVEEASRSRTPRPIAPKAKPSGGMRQRAQSVPKSVAKDDPDHASSSGQVCGDELRAEISRLFLQNEFSGKATQRLVQAAQRAGAQGVANLVATGSSGRHTQNLSRDITRNLAKESSMPHLYWAELPMSSDVHSSTTLVSMPFLLPHEVIGNASDRSKYFHDVPPNMDKLRVVRDRACASLGMDPRLVSPIGLHGDGVPHQKKGNIEVLSWNPCAFPDYERVLFCAIDKKFLCRCGCKGRHTFDAALDIFCWSMCCLTQGAYPMARHDGSKWLSSDSSRSGRGGRELPRALLLQVRADWMWLKQVLGMPGWSNHAICWRCRANQDSHDWRDASLGASWRRHRHTDKSFFATMRAMGVSPSPLFNLPAFQLEYICIDVLHCLDLGFSQMVIGNIMWEYLENMLTGKQADRIDKIFKKLKAHYVAMKSKNRLQGLTVGMLRKDSGTLCLSAKGAETRNLVPFAVVLASELFEADPCHHNRCVMACVSHLLDFYMLMGLDEYNADVGAEACRKCCIMYTALSKEQRDIGYDRRWRQKPKMHLFQELAEYQGPILGNPRRFWAYQDEDFVGWVAKIARSRGGPNQASTAAKRVMLRYRAFV